MVERCAFELQHTDLCDIPPRDVGSREGPSDSEARLVKGKFPNMNFLPSIDESDESVKAEHGEPKKWGNK